MIEATAVYSQPLNPLEILIVLLCSLIVLRLVAFDRERAKTRFKPQYSFLAWLLIVVHGAVAIRVISRDICLTATPWYAFLIPLFFLSCYVIYREHGNVAAMVRSFILPGGD